MYIDDWQDISINASPFASALLAWNNGGCQSSTNPILIGDLCKQLAWCLHCYQHQRVIITTSVDLLASQCNWWHHLKQKWLSIVNHLSDLICNLYRWLIWYLHHCHHNGFGMMVSLPASVSQHCWHHLKQKQPSVDNHLILMCHLCW